MCKLWECELIDCYTGLQASSIGRSQKLAKHHAAQMLLVKLKAQENVDTAIMFTRVMRAANASGLQLNKPSIHAASAALMETRLHVPSEKNKGPGEKEQEEIYTGPQRYCAECGFGGDFESLSLKRCSGCQKIWFCSRRCQQEHWPKHRKDCSFRKAKAKKKKRKNFFNTIFRKNSEQTVKSSVSNSALLVAMILKHLQHGVQNTNKDHKLQTVERTLTDMCGRWHSVVVPESATHGLVHYLATRGNVREWENPVQEGLITVQQSSRADLLNGLSNCSDVVTRELTCCGTEGTDDDCWIAVDFGQRRRIQPTAYYLRHGWYQDINFLLNWKLEGSPRAIEASDAADWVVLISHENDRTLQRSAQVTGRAASKWNLNAANQKDSFQSFRVRLTGPNSSGYRQIWMSGFEIFGKMIVE